MALWLDLVPRIHRPDGFDPRYHLLDDFDNLTSFEEDELMREINIRELHFTTPSPVTSPVTTTTKMASRTLSMNILTKRDNNVWTSRFRRTSSARLHVITTPEPTTSDKVRNLRQNEGDDAETGSSSVGLTVAVGLALLCLNLVVFAAVYCQWKRLRQAKAPELDDFDKAGESEYLQGTKLDPPDVESTENNIARLLSENRSVHRTQNDQRYQCGGETLPLKVRNTPPCHAGNEDYAVMERNTLPKRNSHYDRVTFERVSPTESRMMTPDVTSNHESSTLV